MKKIVLPEATMGSCPVQNINIRGELSNSFPKCSHCQEEIIEGNFNKNLKSKEEKLKK